MKSIVIATGAFDPIHSGHIDYINAAKILGDILVVGLNSDKWLMRKRGKLFLPFAERFVIMDNFKNVDMVIAFDDSDNSSKDAIMKIRNTFPNDKIIFASDRDPKNIPEMDIIDSNLEFVFSVGSGFNKNLSSWILGHRIAKK